MLELRAEVREYIEVAIVELREIAQPNEIAQLRELAMDADDADTEEQLARIRKQAQNLRSFCEKRARSVAGFGAVIVPPGYGRR